MTEINIMWFLLGFMCYRLAKAEYKLDQIEDALAKIIVDTYELGDE